MADLGVQVILLKSMLLCTQGCMRMHCVNLHQAELQFVVQAPTRVERWAPLGGDPVTWHVICALTFSSQCTYLHLLQNLLGSQGRLS